MGCAEVPCSFGHKCNLCQGTQIFCSTFSLWTFLESAFLSVSFQYENFMYKQLKNNLFTTRLILFLQSECVSSYFQCSLLSQAWATAVQSPGALFSTRNAGSVCMNRSGVTAWLQPAQLTSGHPPAAAAVQVPCCTDTLGSFITTSKKPRCKLTMSCHIQVALICFFALL